MCTDYVVNHKETTQYIVTWIAYYLHLLTDMFILLEVLREAN